MDNWVIHTIRISFNTGTYYYYEVREGQHQGEKHRSEDTYALDWVPTYGQWALQQVKRYFNVSSYQYIFKCEYQVYI
jgi:hypothetical protein